MEDLQAGVRKAKSLQMDPQPLRAAAGRLKSQVDSGRLPGAMTCAVKEGHVIHFEAHGFSDLAGQMAMNSRTLFRLYSQTKPVLVVGFLILFERGEVLLDDPVEKYLPEFKDAAVGPQRKPLSRPILVRDLLAHTSGIGFGPGFGYEAENDYESTYVGLVKKVDAGEIHSLAEWCEELAKIPLRFQPGKDWGYGYSSDVLGRLIEVLTKKRLDDFLKEEVLEPLGMANTFFAVPEEQAAKLAALYKREPWHGKAKTVRFVTSDVGGSGIMEDLSRNVLARPEVDKSSVHAMPTSVFLHGGPASKVIQGGGCICSVAGGLVSNFADCSRFFQMIVNNGELDGVRLLKAATVQLLGRDWLNEFTTEKRRRPLWVWNTPGIGFSPLGQIGVKFKGANRRTVGSQLHTVHWGGAGGSGYMLNWPHRLVVLTYSGVVFDTDTQKTMWRAAFGSLRRGGAKPVASVFQEESKDPRDSQVVFCFGSDAVCLYLQATCALAIQKGKQACETSASAFPMTLGSSEPSQTQSTQPEDVPSHSEEVVRLALSTLASALAQANGGHSERLGPALCAALRKEGATKRPLAACATGSPAEDVVLARVRTLSLCAVAYWREVSQDLGRAASSLSRFLEQQRHLYWKRPPYRGVNLGGWLLLEPGPSHELFQTFGPEATCEWRLLDKMRKHFGTQKTIEAIQAHRASFISEEDFRNIRSMGFNAVRIPFGYWIVTGPAKGELYVGPGLDLLDRALTWCQRLGLQALLDLHGAPGGESGEKPCGRERKDWRWEHWRLDESIEALRVIARRYKGHPAVSGIAVCNEPSEKVPADVLCQFYDEAVRTIRTFMPPDEVSIVLPVYRTERLDEIWRLWNRVLDGFASHANVAFDLHLYHCFGAWWQRQGLGSHLRMTKRHRKILRRVPAVVGEWSLALPDRALAQTDIEEAQDQAYKAFAAAQLDAYSHASHGWFFWNWCDSPAHHPGWDARTCFQRHWLAQADLCKSGAPLIPVGGV
ncbi:exgA [Symbiodinium necroappetens]|uniref:glucan 1,3-beta-glucosidase n=1 Tax=Symbiodinium necroappetens TaxID=1628268 RepID=A0A812QWZ3_9DINO|nr:exgA [Symbiodinium necroappetens]